jgi:hypothetical protein
MNAIDSTEEDRAEWFRRIMSSGLIAGASSESLLDECCEDLVLDDELNHEQRIELALAYLRKGYREEQRFHGHTSR